MTRSRQSWILIPLLVSLLACQLVKYAPAWQPPLPTITSTFEPRTGKSVAAARKTATPTAAPTQTLPPPTWTPAPQPTATVSQASVVHKPLTKEVQLAVFEALWTTVKEEYLYPDFNGLDWDAIHNEYRQRIDSGLTPEEFYPAMNEMILSLGDNHSAYLSPDQVALENEEYQGNYDYVGIGILLSAVPDRKRAVILVTFPGSPAEKAGLQPRDNLLEVNGEPILDEQGFLRDVVRGPKGTQVTLTIQTPGHDPRQVTLERQQISTSLPVPFKVLTSPGGKRIGYLLLTSFADSGIDEMVGEALNAMTADKKLDGLIIDDTQNAGGADSVLKPTLAYFTRGVLGYFISREAQRPLEIKRGMDFNGSQSVPLVVLIGPDTVSYGEVFAGVLQDIGRAYIIGTTTGGNVETLWRYDFEDGSGAWIAHESFRPLNHPDQDWEVTGIVPDQTVRAHWDEYTTDDDPLVKAALSHFDNP